jgi:hypothetical protein
VAPSQSVAWTTDCRMFISTPIQHRFTFQKQQLQVATQPDDTIVAAVKDSSDDSSATSTSLPLMVLLAPTVATLKLLFFSWIVSMTIIAWEDVSMFHPMRQANVPPSLSTTIGASTVRGLAFGATERGALPLDLESDILHPMPSYNEVMLQHRTQRVPMWNQFVKQARSSSSKTTSALPKIAQQDVQHAVQTIQRALILLGECKDLAKNYAWEDLAQNLRSPLLRSELDQSASLLKQATEFLSTEARNEVGFDWGSCAWRHCGALADAQEALDELDHHVGMLEPFECAFVLGTFWFFFSSAYLWPPRLVATVGMRVCMASPHQLVCSLSRPTVQQSLVNVVDVP